MTFEESVKWSVDQKEPAARSAPSNFIQSIKPPGPCPGNQELLVLHCDGFVACLDKLLQSPFHARISIVWRVRVKTAALQLLASCVEVRSGLLQYAQSQVRW